MRNIISQRDSGYARKELNQHETPAWVTHVLRDHPPQEVRHLYMIELDGEDLRNAKLEERKRTLTRLLGRFQPGIVVNEYFEGDGAIIYKACLRARL
jgi:ATP-dependent DNA ligase